MSFLKHDTRVGELTLEERAVLWLHKHYPNIEVVDIEAAQKAPTQYIFPDYVVAHIKAAWHKVEFSIYSKNSDTNVNAVKAKNKGPQINSKIYKYY